MTSLSTKTYICQYCNKSFGSNAYLVLHVRSHTGEKPHKCEHCDKAFAHKSNLKEHIRSIHIRDRSFDCEFCEKSYTAKTSLLKHIRCFHYGERRKCEHCDKSFSTISGLNYHMNQNHLAEDQLIGTVIRCEHCDKKFFDKHHLKDHIRTHTGERPFQCDHCDKTFTKKRYLLKHSRKQHEAVQNIDETEEASVTSEMVDFVDYHDPIKQEIKEEAAVEGVDEEHVDLSSFVEVGEMTPVLANVYTCQHCNKSFSCNTQLEQHVRIHTGEKPHTYRSIGSVFKCEFCDHVCNSNSSLKVHIRTHTGERPFVCESCDKSFTRKDHLVRHLKTHATIQNNGINEADEGNFQGVVDKRTRISERPFKCDYCDKSFTRKDHLVRHTRTQHVVAQDIGTKETNEGGLPSEIKDYVHCDDALQQEMKEEVDLDDHVVDLSNFVEVNMQDVQEDDV